MSVELPGRPEQWQVNGLALHGLSWGEPGQRPVLALHGWLDNAASFAVLGPLLQDCHVVALDLTGHGQSDHRSRDASYQVWDDLPEIVGVLEQLGWVRFHLVGHSRGASISTLLASAYSDRVITLSLLDGLAPEPLAEDALPTQLRRAIEDKQRLVARKIRALPSMEKAIATRATPGMEPEAAALIAERNLRRVAEGVAWRTDNRLRGASAVKLTTGHIEAVLAALSMPTLLLLASDGARRHPELAELARRHIASLQVEEIDGGHHFHMEKSAPRVAALLLALFNGAGGEK